MNINNINDLDKSLESNVFLSSQKIKNSDGYDKELLEKYYRVASVLEKEHNDFVLEIGELNAKIGQKEELLKQKEYENKILENNLKNIRKENSTEVQIHKIFIIKHEYLVKAEKKLQNEIKQKEAEIINSKQMEKIYKKDIEFLSNLLSNSSASKIDVLNKEILKLNKEIESKERIIASIKEENKAHRACATRIKNLQKKLQLLKSEHEFEIYRESKVEKEKPRKKIRLVSPNPLVQLRINVERSLKKSISTLWESLENLNAKRGINYLDKSMKNSRSADNLFDQKERKILRVLVPEERLKLYEKQFEKAKMEREKMKEKLTTRLIKGKEKVENEKEKCIQMNFEKQRVAFSSIKSHQEIIKNNLRITRLKVKINELNKEREEVQKVFEKKEKINKQFKKMLNKVEAGN